MSFEHFIAIWPAVLEPQREWSLMETPYKKKINQTHFNSNIVKEWTALWMSRKRITHLTRGGDGEHSLWAFLAENTHTISFSPLCDNKAINRLPFAFFFFFFFWRFLFASYLGLLCFLLLHVWSAWWASVWPHVDKSVCCGSQVIFLLATAVTGESRSTIKFFF